MSGWQPIETAPRASENAAPVCLVLAWFNLGEDGSRHYQVGEGYWHPSGGGRDEGDWWWANTAPGDYYHGPINESISGHVTHWMPLPPVPADASETLAPTGVGDRAAKKS